MTKEVIVFLRAMSGLLKDGWDLRSALRRSILIPLGIIGGTPDLERQVLGKIRGAGCGIIPGWTQEASLHDLDDWWHLQSRTEILRLMQRAIELTNCELLATVGG